jgi:hypothetical protein
MGDRKGHEYSDGELEIILSLVPTDQNIGHLARLLERSDDAIRIVYKQAYEKRDFGKTAIAQRKKVKEVKVHLGISIGN